MKGVSRFLAISLVSFLTWVPVISGSALAQGGSAPPSFSVNPEALSLQDVSGGQQQDAIQPDAASPQDIQALAAPPLSITQSTDTATITSGNSVSCNALGLHTNNSYFRRFDLDGAHGLTSPFSIGSVDIGIEEATGATGSQPVEVRLYSIANGDSLVLANLTLIDSASFSQPDANLIVQNFPVTGTINPLTDDLVVELFTPDGQTAGNSFFIGSNSLGQSAPSYIMAADCSVTEPTETASIGFPDMHIVMIVYRGFSLDVTLAGTGKGTVTSDPAGIDCGTDCNQIYLENTTVNLTVTPEPRSKFKGWSGNADCADGTVTLTGNTACTATFTRFPWPMFLPATTENP